MTTPLQGLKIVDFTRFLPGPYCSLLLADLGADVVRIEQPHEVRKKEAVFGHDRLSTEDMREVKAREIVARNKRSVLLDLRRPAARAAALRMIEVSDVLVHDYRPAVMEQARLDYESVRALNPGLVYCAISLCGQSGPYRDLPGHDPIALALAGALGRFGDGAHAPRIPGAPVSDILTGAHAAIGVLAALRARDATGRGQLVDMAMTDGAFALMTSVFQRYLADGREPPLAWRGGNTGLWRTADGKFLCTTDLERAYWERFCRAVHREDLTPLGHDPQQRDRLDEELGALFLQRTRDEWFDLLRAAGCQAAPAYELGEALSDPHARARGSVVDIEDPRAGRVTQVGPLIKLSETPGVIRWTARPPGADSREVLAECGLNESQIEAALGETAAQDGAAGAPSGKR
jgi:crotonobetainyl-CoA:carnitine CoA-transferase CaiB-like acyl-CoA transferase